MIAFFSLILVGFLLGVVTVVAVEGLGVLLILKRLTKKIKESETKIATASQEGAQELDHQQSLYFAFNKQGFVWVLESDKIPKGSVEKATKDQKRKKDFLEVYPVRKYGKIKGKSLVLLEPGGSSTTIQLKGCIVQSVSASSLPSKKWAKRYPIKLESNSSMYNDNNILYIYLETSWDKESWCKALRLVSCDEKEKLDWFTKLRDEFHGYLASVNAGYPSFMKPSLGFDDPVDHTSKPDASSSKVHKLWKKFSKKSSWVGGDNKSTGALTVAHEEKKNTEKLRQCQDAVFATGVMKAASTSKAPKSSSEESMVPSASSSLNRSESQGLTSANSDADTDEKFGIDEGTLCWNLLISRLFFDAKENSEIKRSLQARIQRTLSNMRTSSYIGEVMCMNIDLGSIPPYIVSAKVLPMELNEVWAIDLEIEYSGAALLEIETRLEVRELHLHKGTVSNPMSSTNDDVSEDLFESIEYFEKQLKSADGLVEVVKSKEDGDRNSDDSNNSQCSSSSTAYGSRWKSILNSIAKQVSQIPLSLAIRVASLRGTLRLHIKPPPSDQLWYGFTSMPDIEFNLESSIGDHRISRGHIAAYLVNKIKASLHETLVLPNCENVYIPWMLAEKDDWIPRNVAPYLWRQQESRDDTPTSGDVVDCRLSSVKSQKKAPGCSSNVTESHQQKPENAEHNEESTQKFSCPSTLDATSNSTSLRDGDGLEELKTPLIEKDGQQEESEQNTSIITSDSPSRSIVLSDKENQSIEQDDTKPKKMGKRERILDMRKKMGEKLEERRRHLEEKGKLIVGKYVTK